MNRDDLYQRIEDEDTTAEEILKETIPGIPAKVKRLQKTMNSIMSEVQKEFPDAQWYVSDRSIHLMLAESHNDFSANQELVGICIDINNLDGGGW